MIVLSSWMIPSGSTYWDTIITGTITFEEGYPRTMEVLSLQTTIKTITSYKEMGMKPLQIFLIDMLELFVNVFIHTFSTSITIEISRLY